MTFKVTIRQYNIPRPNGDRATYNTACYDFKVFVNETCVHTMSQFNAFRCHVKKYDIALAEVLAFADTLADALNVPHPGKTITYVQEMVMKWVPDDS